MIFNWLTNNHRILMWPSCGPLKSRCFFSCTIQAQVWIHLLHVLPLPWVHLGNRPLCRPCLGVDLDLESCVVFSVLVGLTSLEMVLNTRSITRKATRVIKYGETREDEVPLIMESIGNRFLSTKAALKTALKSKPVRNYHSDHKWFARFLGALALQPVSRAFHQPIEIVLTL